MSYFIKKMEVIVAHMLNKRSCTLLLLSWVLACSWTSCQQGTGSQHADFYTFSVDDMSGDSVSLEQYRGKVSLVVNVASQCGYTHNHYRGLVLLQEHFGSTDKFNVLAFPCNQFGQQEPGTGRDIMNFVKHEMGASFPVFAKINVQESNVSPAWRYLTKNSGQMPTWNFWKYLVDHNGHVLNAWGPSTSPDQLYPDIKRALGSLETTAQTEL